MSHLHLNTIYLLSVVQVSMIFAFLIATYLLKIRINYCSYFMRSFLLIILMIIVTDIIVVIRDVYKIWFFSLVVIQYINLYVADFMIPSVAEPVEYQHLDSKRKNMFLAMTSSINYHGYKPFRTTILQQYCTDHVNGNKNDEESKIVDNVDKHDNDNAAGRFATSIFEYNTVWSNNSYAYLFLYMARLYEENKLIIKSETPHKNNSNNNHSTLLQKLASNELFSFDPHLLSLIQSEAEYYQSNKHNQYFDIDDVILVLIFLKFPSFRMLLYQNLLQPSSHFHHFYQRLSFINFSIDLKQKTKFGYTILNYQIINSAPILFASNKTAIENFAKITKNKHQGIVFSVTVCGKFVPLSLFSTDFNDVYMVFVPESIEITKEETFHLNHAALQLGVVLELDQMISTQNVEKLTSNIKTTIHLITVDLLNRLLILYRGKDAAELNTRLLSEFLLNMQDLKLMSQILCGIKTIDIDMKQFFCMIWEEFVHKVADKLSIIRLRKICEKYVEQHVINGSTISTSSDIQILGQTLLEYDKNNIFDQLPDDMQNIEWKLIIDNYIRNNLPKKQTQMLFADEIMTTEEKTDKCLNIMREYNQIINDFTDSTSLHDLLVLIKEVNISELLDVVFELKQQNIQLKKIKAQNQCTSQDHCLIWQKSITSRKHESGFDVHNDMINDPCFELMKMQNENVKSVVELLDFIHVVLFHDIQKERRRFRNISTREFIQDDLIIENLFQDDIIIQTHLELFHWIQENEYDSEALYDDVFPDNDAQSNMYWVVRHNKNIEMNEYYTLKDKLFTYVINPSDSSRNYLHFDYGEHVILWNVNPKFSTMKQEWMENEYYPIDEDIYSMMREKSKIISNQLHNTSRYNLSSADVLCIKMYTDTDELQANFRMSFRASADRNRRSQFVHWATNFHIIFLKVEISNYLYHFNDSQQFTLYYGLNKFFDLMGLTNQFHGLLSTTSKEVTARGFAGDNGMILNLGKTDTCAALNVDWMSVHDENEILLINPKTTVYSSAIFSNDADVKCSYIKSILTSKIDTNPDAFTLLSSNFQSIWISSCLEDMIKDRVFVQRVNFFQQKHFLNGLSLFEFIFFECRHYEIADYINRYAYKTPQEIFEMIIGTDFFVLSSENNNNWIESADRSNKLCSLYQPRMCKMQIIYKYNNNNEITKEFSSFKSKKMLLNTNLILQYIDQTKMFNLKNGLTMNINIQIKYQHMNEDGDKSAVRIWRYNSSNYTISIGDFNWRINQHTILDCNTLHVSTLWITNHSTLSVAPTNVSGSDTTKFRCFCQEDFNIDVQSSIQTKKEIVLLCNNLTVKGTINSELLLIIANQSNISQRNIKQNIKSNCVKFGFITKSKLQNQTFNVDDYYLQCLEIETLHQKQNVIPYSFDIIDKMPLVFFSVVGCQASYLKRKLLSLKYNTQENVSTLFQSKSDRKWIDNCLAFLLFEDTQFIQQIKFFSPQTYFNGMSLFQFLFCECGYYKIPSYLIDMQYVNENEIIQMLINMSFSFDDSLDSETKFGYICSNTSTEQITTSKPIIFCQNLEKMCAFSTKNAFQETISRVIISGKFVPLSSQEEWKNMIMITIPTSIKIAPQNHRNLCTEAEQFSNMLHLSDIESIAKLEITLQKMKDLKILNHNLLSQLLILKRGASAAADTVQSDLKILSEFLLKQNLSLMAQVLLNIKTMNINMKEFFGMVWIMFIDQNIDKMAIIKLRKVCQEIEQEQMSGRILLEYASNGILNEIPEDIRHIKWIKYIHKYTLDRICDTKKVGTIKMKCDTATFVNIMTKYQSIINLSNDRHIKVEQESKLEIFDDKLYEEDVLPYMQTVNSLTQLFAFIDSNYQMSKLMDSWFDIQNGITDDSDLIMRKHQCTLQNDCNILKNNIDTRKYQLLSRAMKTTQTYELKNDSNYNKMEILDLIHVRLFHDQQSNRRSRRNKNCRSDIHTKKLFMDQFENAELKEIRLFCEEEQYDTEAMHDDVVSDDATQSNICSLFEIKVKDLALKEHIKKYIIDMNLVDLDFGDHIIYWNVTAKFKNVKEEWFNNEFFPIRQDLYDSLLEKSQIIVDTYQNQSSYNLTINDMACIKMYTDTNELQGEFRKSFRSSSDKNRRSQFIHWAINFHIVFIKIEIANQTKGCNEYISDQTLYHGLDRLFDTKGLVHKFHGALSTTLAESVATTFAGDAGMILTIDKRINNQNVNAIRVNWISCHVDEEEVLLMNPTVIIQKSHVFLDDPQLQASCLQSNLISELNADDGAFNTLSAFFQSQWIESCLKYVFDDEIFIQKINIFEAKQCLNGMNLFEFIFFECKQYQIADYVKKYVNTDLETFELIFGRLPTDFFIIKEDWIQSVNRTNKLCSKYQPRKCTMHITYDYGNDDQVSKEFDTKQGKKMLINPNLLLQYIDQRKIFRHKNGLTININAK
eukprot:484302_1